MDIRFYDAIGPPLPLTVPGYCTFSRNKDSCNGNIFRLKNGARRPHFRCSFARSRRIRLQELHVKYTAIKSVPEFRDFSEEIVPQINFYMGDADDSKEEIEEPAKYVPPPPLNHEDSEMIAKAEEVLYTMKDFLCTSFKKREVDWKNCYAIRKLFSQTVEFQDPIICFRGIESLIWWLDGLSDAPIGVNVDDIYSQYIGKEKAWIYVLWTITLKIQERSFLDLGIQECWKEEYWQLLHYLHNEENGKNICPSFLGNEGLSVMDWQSSLLNSENNMLLQEHNGFGISGEAKLEINSLGQIVSIHIKWYLLRDKSEELQMLVKQLLFALLSRKA